MMNRSVKGKETPMEKERKYKTWGKEIYTLADDLNIPRKVAGEIIRETEGECEKHIPLHYNGDKEACLYDRAQRKLIGYYDKKVRNTKKFHFNKIK